MGLVQYQESCLGTSTRVPQYLLITTRYNPLVWIKLASRDGRVNSPTTWEASKWAEVSPSCCRSQPICLSVTWMSYLLASEHLYQIPDHPQQKRGLLVTQVQVLALPPQDADLPPQVLDPPTKDPDLPPQDPDLTKCPAHLTVPGKGKRSSQTQHLS